MSPLSLRSRFQIPPVGFTYKQTSVPSLPPYFSLSKQRLTPDLNSCKTYCPPSDTRSILLTPSLIAFLSPKRVRQYCPSNLPWERLHATSFFNIRRRIVLLPHFLALLSLDLDFCQQELSVSAWWGPETFFYIFFSRYHDFFLNRRGRRPLPRRGFADFPTRPSLITDL